MKLRIYLDTSVFGAFQDDRLPDRQTATQEFWARLTDFDAATSDLARQELAQAPDESLRRRLLEMLAQVTVHPVTAEMRQLALKYVDAAAFGSAVLNDAIHVAAAVLTHQDVLVSWNFKHLVNRRRRAVVNQVNVLSGLPMIEIVAPPEV